MEEVNVSERFLEVHTLHKNIDPRSLHEVNSLLKLFEFPKLDKDTKIRCILAYLKVTGLLIRYSHMNDRQILKKYSFVGMG